MTINNLTFATKNVYLNVEDGDTVQTITCTADDAKENYGSCYVRNFFEPEDTENGTIEIYCTVAESDSTESADSASE